MTCINVSTQVELDLALRDNPDACIHTIGDGEFVTSGSSTVRASGSSTVRAYDSSTVTASGSSTVRASGSSTVRASGSSTVRAYDSSTVRAYDSSTVTAYDSSTVTASGFVAVHKLHDSVTVTGGHVITPPNFEGADAATWLSYHGIEPDDNGIVILYKAVNDEYTTARGFDYSPGAKPKAERWVRDAACGNGLHFGPSPTHAMNYYLNATKFMACPIRANEISVIDQQKIKARRVVGNGCYEVDIDGKPIVS